MRCRALLALHLRLGFEYLEYQFLFSGKSANIRVR